MGGALVLFRRDGKPIPPSDWERGVRALCHRSGTPELSQKRDLAIARWVSRSGMAHPSGCLVAGDFRLDDRSHLDSQLGLPPESTDDERIVAAYLRWGDQLVDHVLGDFSFVLWDPKRQRFFVARDSFGVKPFFYVLNEQSFGYASEIEPLLASGWASSEIDESRVADFLAMVYEDKTRTFYRDVRRLPAGHAGWISAEGQRFSRYWRPDPSLELEPASDEEYVEQFREHFDRAVADRLVGAERVGSTLSGGLDSSSIAVTAARRTTGLLPTFSAVFPSLPADELTRIDERPFMNSVVESASLEPHFVECDRSSPLGSVDSLLRHVGQPFFGPNLYMHWELYRAARAAGVDVLLDGIDGDSTVSHGLEHLGDLFRQGKLVSLWRQAAQISKTRPSDRLTAGTIVWRLGVLPNLPPALLDGWREFRRYPREDWLATSRIHPEFARRAGLLDRRGRFDGQVELVHGTGRERHAAVLDSAVLTDVFELADGAASAFGIEPRYPFMDRRLAEFCLALPIDQKLKDGWTRSILRRSMEGRLPEDVRWRFLKTNLSPNFLRQIRERDFETVQAVLEHPPELLESFVDLSAVQDELKTWTESDGSRGDAYCLHRLTVLGKWLMQRQEVATTL